MTPHEARILGEEIKKLKPNLVEWEKGFLGNVYNYAKISNKQARILQEMYAKATGGGQYERRQYV